MAVALRTLALGLAACLFAACDDGLTPASSSSTGCPAGYETCDGAHDCFSTCMCERSDRAACDSRCPASPGPHVVDFDEADWSSDWTAFEEQVLELTNRARAGAGCCDATCFPASAPLRDDPRLRRAARSHAEDMDMRSYFAHETPDGATPIDRIRESGFRGCSVGENIAAGQPTPESVMDAWLMSPGHCTNIREPGFTRIGVGYHASSANRYGHYWVQNFGG